MKKLFYLPILLSVILISCESNPEAGFFYDETEPEVGQKVLFTNDSHNADRFEWDFGDGTMTDEPNPVHIFNSTGSFEVTLTAISSSGLEDIAVATINVLVLTLLVIEVVEYYDEYVVPDASVILYPTLTDWEDETDKVMEGFTDSYGTAVFANLDPYVYYVDVWEENHNNYTLASEDVGFIITPDVMPNKINWFTAKVDYVQGKGAKGKRELVIKKLERKVPDKSAKPTDDTIGWEELYNRRVNK
jgi:PKD repeat protein